jgi:hypothetical protein
MVSIYVRSALRGAARRAADQQDQLRLCRARAAELGLAASKEFVDGLHPSAFWTLLEQERDGTLTVLVVRDPSVLEHELVRRVRLPGADGLHTAVRKGSLRVVGVPRFDTLVYGDRLLFGLVPALHARPAHLPEGTAQ